jgi:hypothetical protein
LNEAAYNTLILRDFAFSSSDVPNNQWMLIIMRCQLYIQ